MRVPHGNTETIFFKHKRKFHMKEHAVEEKRGETKYKGTEMSNKGTNKV